MVQLKNGGGIRATLFTTYQRFDYNFVLTILLAIKAAPGVATIAREWQRLTLGERSHASQFILRLDVRS